MRSPGRPLGEHAFPPGGALGSHERIISTEQAIDRLLRRNRSSHGQRPVPRYFVPEGARALLPGAAGSGSNRRSVQKEPVL